MSSFYGCSSLTGITIPDSVTSIGMSAFKDCSGLTSITFLSAAPEIGTEGLPNRESLTAYYPAEEESSYETAKEQFPDINWVAVHSVTPGDVNGDSTVNFQDAQLVLQHEAGLVTLSEEQLEAADVNGDGTINFQDAQLILQYEAGLIDSFDKKG